MKADKDYKFTHKTLMDSLDKAMTAAHSLMEDEGCQWVSVTAMGDQWLVWAQRTRQPITA